MIRVPTTNAASLPSRATVRPSARPMMPKTRHATGNENFCWIAMISGCGESPSFAFCSASCFSSAIDLFVDARLQVDFGEHRFGVEPEDQGGGEARGVGLPRLRRAIAGPVDQDQIDAALFAVDYQPSLGGEVHRRLVALVGIGDHQFFQPGSPGSGSSFAYSTQPGKSW